MSKKIPSVRIKQPALPAEPVGAEVIATSIKEIADGMKKLNATRLKRDAIVTLIARSSDVARSTIEIVLNNLEELEATWLKKVAVLLIVIGTAACTSKYAVKPVPVPDNEISVNGQSMVSIKADGTWVWRMPPEKVVEGLIGLARKLEEDGKACQAELAKRSAVPAPTPAPVQAAAVEKSTGTEVAK